MNELDAHAQAILIVDDNEEDYMFASRAFKKINLQNQTFWCKSGQEALQYLRHEGVFSEMTSPDLMLLDLHMPGMDGHETLRVIKNDQSLKSLPVIMFTSSDSNKDVRACFQEGANSYVQKPVSFEKMNKAIKGLSEYWFEISLLPKEDCIGSAPESPILFGT